MSFSTQKLIVLRKIKFQESDLIIHGINSQGMKVSFLAKGALKSRKRFAGGVLDPFHYIEVGLGRTAGSSPSAIQSSTLRTISEAKLIRGFDGIKLDYDRLQLGFYFLELIYKVTQAGEIHDESLFQLLGHVLMALEIAVDFSILKVQFIIKFLMQQGVLQTESWMNPFLQTALSQNAELSLHKEKILSYDNLDKMEKMVQNYLQSAQVE